MKISVLLPVYNGELFLKGAIESILTQNFGDFEFIIVDDGSTDGSRRIIRRYERSDRRIKMIAHSSNMGLAESLNHGLWEARGQYIIRMDQDDQAFAHRLQTQYMFMITRPDVVVAGSYIFQMGKSREKDRLVKFPTDSLEIKQRLKDENCICHPSVIFDRKRIVDLGGYYTKYRNAEDYDLWLRAAKKYSLANIPIGLIRYRVNIEGMTVGRKWEQLYYFFVAKEDNDCSGNVKCDAGNLAAEKLKKVDKKGFFISVTRQTAEELLQLGFFNDLVRLLRRSYKRIGLKGAIGVLVHLFRYQMIMHFRGQEENWPVGEIYSGWKKW